jgi:hypothetical protein
VPSHPRQHRAKKPAQGIGISAVAAAWLEVEGNRTEAPNYEELPTLLCMPNTGALSL